MNSLTAYILRRLAILPLTLIGATIVVFLIVRHPAAGDPVAAQLGELNNIDPAARAEAEKLIRARLHLDESYPVQYFYWIADLWNTGLGTSVKHNRPVAELVAERLPVTLGINSLAFLITYIIAIPLGMLSAVNHNRLTDRTVTMGTFLLYSMPPIWVGTMLLVFLAGPDQWNLFPSAKLSSPDADRMLFVDWFWDRVWHLVLPVATLSYSGFAYLSRQMRAGLLDNLRQDFVRTARAKGLSGRAVLLGHVLPNSLIPLITILGTLLPALIAGTVIVETIFSIDGMGRMTYEALQSRDFAVIQAMAGVAGGLNMVGLLLADIAYAVADPRITYG